uniref:Uncharacterized protein n=1 Tax=viral metagenome TaxID=1070528 RepID=A0A6C0LDD5_9ZZZZ
MSGNRANAAARNRRAGGGPEMQPPMQPGRGMARPVQQQQQYQQQIPMPVPLPNGVPTAPKQMTIQNAVSLITIRLGRVETFIQKMESENPTLNEDSRIVEEGVFNSIISRLDALERGHKLLTTKTVTTNVVNSDSTDQLSEEVQSIKNDVVELKGLLLQLQSFTMQTNQKLLESFVFSGREQQSGLMFMNEDEGEDDGEDEDEDEEDQEDSETVLPGTESILLNLKEIVQKELNE